jgi:4-amino-4-deoxy-L-arabinose transferase-like glycosyltransferase
MIHLLSYLDPAPTSDGSGGASALPAIILLVVVATSIWVFFDAPAHGLSRTWGLGCLAFWIIAFPWYLVERGKRPRGGEGHNAPSQQPPGWYPDPIAPGRRRYWNGMQWTDSVDN